MKKFFGIKHPNKGEDSDEESASYTDPAFIHATDPPRNSKGISQPHYPPPRPCHSGSPSPRRKNEGTVPVQGNKNCQLTESNRNSFPALAPGEPKRAPPRINVTKKTSVEPEDDYCDPIDVQRRDDFIQELKKERSDYCEPWDSTMKTDNTNVPSKKPSNSDDENNEYLDPYDTGKVGKMDKRLSRGIGKDFGVHPGRNLNTEQRKSGIEVDPKHPAFDQSKTVSDDYDTPWEWKQKLLNMQQQNRMQVPKPIATSSKPAGPSGDYDEPWEKKQGYLFKTSVPHPSGKSRSPVPLPRNSHPPSNEQIYEQPFDGNSQPNTQPPQTDEVYEAAWEVSGGGAANGRASPRRFSQPIAPSNGPASASRKFSQPGARPAPSDDYDMPWEYKNRQFGVGPPKPVRLHELADAQEINPDLPLDQQSWYHGPLTRQEAEDSLRSALDCSFLVRNSESSKKDFSLSMKNNENFLHLKIVRQNDGQFILGQFSKPFIDIPKVIHHYSKNKLNIRGAEHKYLKHPITTQPEYHTIEPEDDDGVAL